MSSCILRSTITSYKLSLRYMNLSTEDTNDDSIILSDVEDYILDEGINLDDSGNGTHKIGFA